MSSWNLIILFLPILLGVIADVNSNTRDCGQCTNCMEETEQIFDASRIHATSILAKVSQNERFQDFTLKTI